METQQAWFGFLIGTSCPLVGFAFLLEGATAAAVQCAYPALKRLEFDIVNSPHVTSNRVHTLAEGKTCPMAPRPISSLPPHPNPGNSPLAAFA